MPNKGFTLWRSKVAEILFRYPRHWFCFLSLVKDMALLMLSLVWKQELEVWKHFLNKCIVAEWCCKAYKRARAQRELSFPNLVKFYFWIRASRAVWHSHHSAELWRPKGIYADMSLLYMYNILSLRIHIWDFPGGSVVKNPPGNARDTGLIPDPGRCHIPRRN